VLVDPTWEAAGYVFAVLIALGVAGRLRLRICMRVFDEIPRLAASALIPVLALLPFMRPVSRLLWLAALSVGLLIVMRALLYATLRALHRVGKLTDDALIIGNGRLGVGLRDALQQHPELGLRPIGFIGGSRAPSSDSYLPLLGTVSDVPHVIADHDVRTVIVCFPAGSDEEVVSMLRSDFPAWANVYVVPRMYELGRGIPTGCMDEVWGIPLMPLRRSGLQSGGRFIKRSFDLFAGTLLFLAFAPVLILLIGVQLSFCGRPVFFRQERITRSGRIIKIMKFRTVSCPAPDSQWTVSADGTTPVGRWLRFTHLDELPQLVNVIRGDMSLVGPRPERPYFASQFAEVIPRYDDRHRTSTGMTGWAQVHGLTGDTSIAERARFDNYYIEHWSLWLDVLILTRTLTEPLSGALRARRNGADTRR
jgi:exopolysaccharide biosynthesis polyprenyl glycosylphosphotransferase